MLKEGRMHLHVDLYLHNALFVPNMNCIVILVAKLLRELNCTITFIDKLCVIQDRTLRTLIGMGKKRDRSIFSRQLC